MFFARQRVLQSNFERSSFIMGFYEATVRGIHVLLGVEYYEATLKTFSGFVVGGGAVSMEQLLENPPQGRHLAVTRGFRKVF